MSKNSRTSEAHAAAWLLRHAILAGSVFVASATTGFAQSPPALPDDWAKRSAEIHWPASHTPDKADLFAHNEGFIRANCAVVWQRLIEAKNWPQWYPNSKDVRIVAGGSDALESGSQFAWSTFGLQVASRVNEFVPQARLGWFGEADGIDAYHTWLLMPANDGCQVVTEEVVKGPGAVALRNSDLAAMHKGHDLWLATLKAVAEK